MPPKIKGGVSASTVATERRSEKRPEQVNGSATSATAGKPVVTDNNDDEKGLVGSDKEISDSSSDFEPYTEQDILDGLADWDGDFHSVMPLEDKDGRLYTPRTLRHISYPLRYREKIVDIHERKQFAAILAQEMLDARTPTANMSTSARSQLPSTSYSIPQNPSRSNADYATINQGGQSGKRRSATRDTTQRNHTLLDNNNNNGPYASEAQGTSMAADFAMQSTGNFTHKAQHLLAPNLFAAPNVRRAVSTSAMGIMAPDQFNMAADGIGMEQFQFSVPGQYNTSKAYPTYPTSTYPMVMSGGGGMEIDYGLEGHEGKRGDFMG